MKVRKAFKYRLNVSKEKQSKFFQFAGCCRFVWNKCWRLNLERLTDKHRILRYTELDFWVKLWKKSEDYDFLKDCHSQLLQQKLKDLDKAFMDCFDKKQPNKRMPRPKKKGMNDSFRYPQGFKINGNNIFLPKLGWYKFRQSRSLEGVPKNVTVSYYAGQWYISIQTEIEVAEPKHPKTNIVGIDVGISKFAVLSTGKYFKSRSYFRKLKRQLAIAQRSLSRKVKFSNNWHKQKKKIQKIHAKIKNSRRDYLNWCSHRISQNHAVIVMEDLKIGNMSRSAKGDIENPGKNVRAKSGLNQSILDQGWYEFRRQLVYKSKWLGGDVLFVNPKYTSQTCPSCKHQSSENRKTQSEFKCVDCGYTNNADVVGAINVCRAGHAQLACGELQVEQSAANIEDVSLQAQESSRVAA